MTTNNLLEEVKNTIDNLFLNERALKTLNKIKAVEWEADTHPEFLKGFSRKKVVFKPQEQLLSLYNHSGFDPAVITIIGIYVEDTIGIFVENLRPIGYFEYETSIEGEYINDHLEITESKHSS